MVEIRKIVRRVGGVKLGENTRGKASTPESKIEFCSTDPLSLTQPVMENMRRRVGGRSAALDGWV